MSPGSLSDAKAALVRQRVLSSAATVLGAGQALTFGSLAASSQVPERTLYRYFPNREALMSALFDWTNDRIGFSGKLPKTQQELVQLVRAAFLGFDSVAAVVHELLVAPEGKVARLARKAERQAASLRLSRTVAPNLDRGSARALAAVLQLLASASTWQALRDYWDMDGEEAGEAASLAIELLVLGAREKARRSQRG